MYSCVCLCVVIQRLNETEDLYKDLQMKVDSLGGASGDLGNINQRAKEIKKEAEDLLTKADKGIENLRSVYHPAL